MVTAARMEFPTIPTAQSPEPSGYNPVVTTFDYDRLDSSLPP
jgi:hypothetical protein